jgi:arginine exporter protein ArgO
MDSIRGWPAVVVLVVVAFIFLVMALLYALGVLQWFTTSHHAHHLTHAIFFAGLAVVVLIGASFLRPRND